METGIAVIESTPALQLFAPGVLNPLVERIEREYREKDKKHKAGINSAAVHAIALHCYITEENAKLVVTAIAQGKIPNVKISY